TERHRQQNAHGNADGYDKGIGDIAHGGLHRRHGPNTALSVRTPASEQHAKQGPPMRQKLRIGPHIGAPSIFLLIAWALVYCVGVMGEGAAQKSRAAPRVSYGTAELPGPVQEMRNVILSA